MTEKIIQTLVADLGPTGILVVGLYLALGRPLAKMARHLAHINDEVGAIINLLNRIDARKNGKN